MDTAVKISIFLIVLTNLILEKVESINYGKPRRLQNVTEIAIITQESRSNVAALQKPERNESTILNQPSSRRSGTPYTIFYPLVFPQSRGGKYLNLTLPSEPPEADHVEGRIINHPELFSYFQSSPQQYNRGRNPSTSAPRRDLANEPDIPFTNPQTGQNNDPNTHFDSGRMKDLRNIFNSAVDSYYKGSGTLPTPPEKQISTSIPSSLDSYRKTFTPQVNVVKSQPRRLYKSRVQYPQIPFRPNRTSDENNLQLLRYVKINENIPAAKPQINNKGRVNSQPTRLNNPLGNDSLVPPTRNVKPKYGSPYVFSVPPENNRRTEENPQYKKGTNYVSERPKTYPDYLQNIPETPSIKYKVKSWNSCYCIPYYLCKDGIINSGGRSITSVRRQSRSLEYAIRNSTVSLFDIEPKIVNENPESPLEEQICEENKVCCQVSFTEENYDNNDDTYYPVATPPPDPEPSYASRYPDRRRDQNTCGIRRAYGIQARLNQVQYPADVSEFGEYPWQIAVLKKVEGDKNLYLCGGVLISNQWVATAAHCIKKDKTSPLIIRLGEWDVNRKDEVYPYIEEDVDAIIIHPEFNSENLQNDLALIRMHHPVNPQIPHVNPACLPKQGQTFDDKKCWVSGWGKDFFGPQGDYQNVLKEVDVPVVSRSVCTNELRGTNLGPQFALHPGFLCAGGEPGKDACTGDGGSPLVCKSDGYWYVVGLVSWGIGCGQPGIPGVYVNIMYYIDWINSIIWT